jgi:hypothetical protein
VKHKVTTERVEQQRGKQLRRVVVVLVKRREDKDKKKAQQQRVADMHTVHRKNAAAGLPGPAHTDRRESVMIVAGCNSHVGMPEGAAGTAVAGHKRHSLVAVVVVFVVADSLADMWPDVFADRKLELEPWE